MAAKRIRRSEEQLVADLEARILALKQRAARKVARRNPAVRHTSAAVKSIDKALAATDDNATRKALLEARATLSACLQLDGVPSAGAPRAAASAVSSEVLLDYVKKHPNLRGEQISAALGSDSRTIRPVMQKLIAAKKVKTRGERRAMTYQAV